MFIISQLWLIFHPRSTVVLLDRGTPGTSRESYSEDANDGTRTGTRMRSQRQLRNDKHIMMQYTNRITSTLSQQQLFSSISRALGLRVRVPSLAVFEIQMENRIEQPVPGWPAFILAKVSSRPGIPIKIAYCQHISAPTNSTRFILSLRGLADALFSKDIESKLSY